MTSHIESFSILGTEWGIEDHEDGGPADRHFFHNKYLSGEAKRFRLWRGGSGFGQADTLQEARDQLTAYAVKLATEEKKRAEAKLSDCRKVLADLNGSSAAAGLGPYRT